MLSSDSKSLTVHSLQGTFPQFTMSLIYTTQCLIKSETICNKHLLRCIASLPACHLQGHPRTQKLSQTWINKSNNTFTWQKMQTTDQRKGRKLMNIDAGVFTNLPKHGGRGRGRQSVIRRFNKARVTGGRLEGHSPSEPVERMNAQCVLLHNVLVVMLVLNRLFELSSSCVQGTRQFTSTILHISCETMGLLGMRLFVFYAFLNFRNV